MLRGHFDAEAVAEFHAGIDELQAIPIGRDNLPFQRMSIYPDHVLRRLSDAAGLLTAAGYV